MIRRGSALKLVAASVLGLGVAGAAVYKMGIISCGSCTKDAAASAPVDPAAPAVTVAAEPALANCAEKATCAEKTQCSESMAAKTCCPLAGLAAAQAAATESAATPAALDAAAKPECCKTDGTACCKEGGSCPSKTPGTCDKSECPSEAQPAAEPTAQNDQPKGNG